MKEREWLYDGRAWLWFGWLCVATAVVTFVTGHGYGVIHLGWAACGFLIGAWKRSKNSQRAVQRP